MKKRGSYTIPVLIILSILLAISLVAVAAGALLKQDTQIAHSIALEDEEGASGEPFKQGANIISPDVQNSDDLFSEEESMNTAEESISRENTPSESISGENIPDKNMPGENALDENTPGENIPKENTPGKNIPGENIPDENTPGENKENISGEHLSKAGEATQNPETSNTNENARTGALAGAIIGIDAGHQARGNSELEKSAPGSSTMKAKVTSGTSGVASKIPEHVVNLDVALILKEKLEEQGAEVLMVREIAEVNISNVQRATMMNERGVDLCIRIHANGSENGNARGAMMLVPKGMSISGLEDASRTAGEIIFESFLSATGAKDAGIIPRNDLTGFNWSEVPVCLIELGFMTNPDEDLLLTSREYQNKCADGLANGIVSWWTAINYTDEP